MKLFFGDGVDMASDETTSGASEAPETTPTKAPRKPRPKKAAAKKASKRTKAASPRKAKAPKKAAPKAKKKAVKVEVRSYTPHAEVERSGYGLRVYRARLKRGISQTKLGRACKCHQSRISDIEAGRREPTEKQKMGIKRAVGV